MTALSIGVSYLKQLNEWQQHGMHVPKLDGPITFILLLMEPLLSGCISAQHDIALIFWACHLYQYQMLGKVQKIWTYWILEDHNILDVLYAKGLPYYLKGRSDFVHTSQSCGYFWLEDISGENTLDETSGMQKKRSLAEMCSQTNLWHQHD